MNNLLHFSIIAFLQLCVVLSALGGLSNSMFKGGKEIISRKNQPSIGNFGAMKQVATVSDPTGWSPQASPGGDFLSISTVSDSVAWTVGGYGGIILKTTNGGTTWDYVPQQLPEEYAVNIYALNTDTALVCTYSFFVGTRIYRTTTGGTNWSVVYQDSRPGAFMDAVYMFDKDTGVALGDPVNGWWVLLKTTNGGMTWNSLSTIRLRQANGEIGWNNSLSWSDRQHGWFGTSNNRVYFTTNGGTTWSYAHTPMLSSTGISFATTQSGVIGGGLGNGEGSSRGQINRSTDGGNSWDSVTSVSASGDASVSGLSLGLPVWWVAASRFIYYTSNQGMTWTQQHQRQTLFNSISIKYLPSYNKIVGWAVGFNGQISKYEEYPSLSLAQSNIDLGYIVIGTTETTSVTVKNSRSIPLNIFSISSSDSLLSVEPTTGIIPPADSLVIQLTFQLTSLGPDTAKIIFLHDGFEGTDTLCVSGIGAESMLQLSINNRWNLVSVPLSAYDYNKSTVFPTSISDAYAYQGNYETKDSLRNSIGYWLKFSESQEIMMFGSEIYSDSSEVLEGWNLIGSISAPLPVSQIVSNPPNIVTSQFYGYEGGYLTQDTIKPGKGYWVKINQSGKLIFSSEISVNASNRIRIVPITELPPPAPDEVMSQDYKILNVPTEFALEQNYPNPFNPVTIISYQLPVNSFVNLKVYNLLGQEVATLVDEMQNAGDKTIAWDASSLPSGIYFIKMKSGEFTATRKTLLIK